MNTLAFDTCFDACSVAVTWRADQTIGRATRFERLDRGHAERLLPMIGEAMAEAPFDFADLQRIVVTVGPGTFTGQRVGIAAARALSLATGAPVASLTSLSVMAYAAAHELGGDTIGKTLVVAVDARRGEIYTQSFAGAPSSALGPPVLITPQDAVHAFTGMDVVAVGSGAKLIAEAARALGNSITAILPTLSPDVRFIPEAAIPSEFGEPRPLYLRPPDAKPQAGALHMRSP